jgi:hypothetical protein
MNIEAIGTLLFWLDRCIVGKGSSPDSARNVSLPLSLCDQSSECAPQEITGGLCMATPKVIGEDVIIHCDKLENISDRRIVFDLLSSFFFPFFVFPGKFIPVTDKSYKKIILLPWDVYNGSDRHNYSPLSNVKFSDPVQIFPS